MPNPDAPVDHPKFGSGRVMMDNGVTVVVRFEHGIEECEVSELTISLGPLNRIEQASPDPPLAVVLRVLAEAIRSTNDLWGVLSLSRIALLPHQLWVCRKVMEQWPTRWLVADDVGLGKTIEAGLILSAIRSRIPNPRILVICPASLTEQWRDRLFDMFEVPTDIYSSDGDRRKSQYWQLRHQVVASLQTLRDDNNGRHQRILDAPAWDILIVDEAHHLNSDEQSGPTKGYQFIEKLNKAKKLNSIVFFTGTPHRGKDFGFLSLLKLLHPLDFDPKTPLADQAHKLAPTVIRNNKQSVTDLSGNRLFRPPIVDSITYQYSPEERRFYELLTSFIASGQAYAATLGQNDQRAVALVLIAMQKLASSSVAAIKRAIERRLKKTISSTTRLEELQKAYEEASESLDTDTISRMEEELAYESARLSLMQDEEPRLRELLVAADEVQFETKISRILDLVNTRFSDRTILFFTEYKATQSLLMSSLIAEFGDDCVTFINGDSEARDVATSNGKSTIRITRHAAAELFNTGKARFLVSTEAAGEGIDLQKNCHTLMHVDLPWNPMRMHQRVGRVNRYGQTRQVEVMSIRNPNTVESRVWTLLKEKLDRITASFREVMADPEDMEQLVLGMTSPRLMNELYSKADTVPPEAFSDWFDERTRSFGKKDVVDAVKTLVGSVSKFDFQLTSSRIPSVDLSDLRPFFTSMLWHSGRRVIEANDKISFKMPEAWEENPRALPEYENVGFDRTLTGERQNENATLGIGHVAVDEAVKEARGFKDSVTSLPAALWPRLTFIYRVADRVTSTGSTVRALVVGVAVTDDGHEMHLDWQLITQLNHVLSKRSLRRDETPDWSVVNTETIMQHELQARGFLDDRLNHLEASFNRPQVTLLAVVAPDSLSASAN